MSESTSANTIARERVDNLASQNGEPNWLKDSRVESWEAYLQLPMPSARDEDWRRTEIDSLDLSRLTAVDLAVSSLVDKAKIDGTPSWFQDALKHIPNHSGVVAEGAKSSWSTTLAKELSDKGVVFCSIKTALAKHQELLGPIIAQKPRPEVDGKFGLMNKALFNSGAFLYIPNNVEVDAPFLSLINLGEPSHEQGIAVFSRVIVVVGANSKANLVNVLSSADVGAKTKEAKPSSLSLANASIEVHIAQNATLNYVELQNFSPSIFAVTRNDNDVAKDGAFNSLTIGLGGGQLKSDISTVLQATGAHSDIQGIVLGAGSEHFSFNTIQEHASPDTTSNINFRVALKDTASSVYQGIIKVDKVAQRTNAFQSNKNLLLGSEARADSIPKLEILADDVKCSHGATVGPVDREQIFYLMSRGLCAPEAEELIVSGFFRQVLETCTISGASDWIFALVAEKIHATAN